MNFFMEIQPKIALPIRYRVANFIFEKINP